MKLKQQRYLHHYILQGGVCYYCKKPLWTGTALVDCNIDHKVPQSRGGKDTLDNTCLTCIPCNASKGNMTEEEVASILALVGQGVLPRSDVQEYGLYLRLKEKFKCLETQLNIASSAETLTLLTTIESPTTDSLLEKVETIA